MSAQHSPLAFIWKILKSIQYIARILQKISLIFIFFVMIKNPFSKIIFSSDNSCHRGGRDIARKPLGARWNLEGVELPLDRDSQFLDEDFVVFLFKLCLVQKQDSFPK